MFANFREWEHMTEKYDKNTHFDIWRDMRFFYVAPVWMK